NVEGSVGLRMRFGVEPGALVADIRECARVCRDEQPDPALEFIEHVQPVTDADTEALLDLEFETLLAGPVGEADEQLLPVVPTSVLERYGEARSFTVKVGHAHGCVVPSLELRDIMRRTQVQRDGERVKALRGGRISLNSDSAGNDVLGEARADKWIEANVSLGAHRFFLLDGEWFEIGVDYVRASRAEIAPLFPVEPSVVLPPWSVSDHRTEYDYNLFAADRSLGEYLCLDKNRAVRNPLDARSSVEACDLLGPGNELIHVKRAAGSAPLSHLFAQGVNSAQYLVTGPAAVRERFVQTVRGLPRGRVLPADFRPRTVVYAILLKNGKELTPTTLFPFSQATLAQAARLLGTYGIRVEVVGIPDAPGQSVARVRATPLVPSRDFEGDG
ncbi:MAG: TIGR04141 family sporadically distributed protein, partial [Trebonia sp.]